MHDETMANKRIDVKADAREIANKYYKCSGHESRNEDGDDYNELVSELVTFASRVRAEATRETVDRCARLHENIPNHCDRHNDTKQCCEAMGAIIRYRDAIRESFAEPGNQDEICWLIERGQQEGQSPPCWWAGQTHAETGWAWTFNADKAIKYPTKAAAEEALEAISGIKGVHSPMGHVTEHAFVSPAIGATTEYQQAIADADHDNRVYHKNLRQFVDAAVRLADAHMEYPASGHPDDMADTETILRLAPQFREQAP